MSENIYGERIPHFRRIEERIVTNAYTLNRVRIQLSQFCFGSKPESVFQMSRQCGVYWALCVIHPFEKFMSGENVCRLKGDSNRMNHLLGWESFPVEKLFLVTESVGVVAGEAAQKPEKGTVSIFRLAF